jgi:hypothetical protein
MQSATTSGNAALSISSTTKPLTYNPSTGDLTSAGNVTAYSDNRYKKSWKVFGEDFLGQFAKTRYGTYQLKSDKTNRRMIGVSAQSLAKTMPEAIIADEKGKLSVAYGNAALAACVELAKEVISLRARLDALEGK